MKSITEYDKFHLCNDENEAETTISANRCSLTRCQRAIVINQVKACSSSTHDRLTFNNLNNGIDKEPTVA